MPIFIYVLGWLVVGEPLYPSFIVASAITFTGLLIFYQAEIKEALRKQA
jgi:drug/metabolite transporter (DMT)-like permease